MEQQQYIYLLHRTATTTTNQAEDFLLKNIKKKPWCQQSHGDGQYNSCFTTTLPPPNLAGKIENFQRREKKALKKNIDFGTNDTDTFYIFIKIYICIHKKLVKHSILTVYNSQTTTKNKLLHFKSEKL